MPMSGIRLTRSRSAARGVIACFAGVVGLHVRKRDRQGGAWRRCWPDVSVRARATLDSPALPGGFRQLSDEAPLGLGQVATGWSGTPSTPTSCQQLRRFVEQ